jgi:hypothetical protein
LKIAQRIEFHAELWLTWHWKGKTFKNLLVKNQNAYLEHLYVVYSIILWSFTKIVQTIPLGSKMTHHGGHLFNIDFYMENFKEIFFSKTPRPRTLIFGMCHHVVVSTKHF